MTRMNARLFRLVLCGGLLAGSAVLARANDALDPEVIKAQTGDWLLAAQDGKPGCVLSLKADETIGGYAVEHADACAATRPSLAEVSAWNFDGDGGVVLIDALRKVKGRFASGEGSPLMETGDDSEHLIMVPAEPGIDHFPSPADLKGKWVMQRPSGEALCTVDLNDRKDDSDNYGLTLDKACKPDVRKLKFSSWMIEAGNLIFMGSDGTSLDFQMSPKGFVKNKAERGKPLVMVRP